MSDDGWKSRKLWIAVLAMSLILVGFLKCQDRNGAFNTYVIGLLTSAGLFKAANLVEKIKLGQVNGEADVEPESPAKASP